MAAWRRQRPKSHRSFQLRLGSSSHKHKDKHKPSSSSAPRPGGTWIYLGWTVLGLVGVDQALQHKQASADAKARKALAVLQKDAEASAKEDWERSVDQRANTAPVGASRIARVDPCLDGTKMLTRHRGVQRGDAVDVLETGVGPAGRYHLCRWTKGGANENANANENAGDGSAVVVVGWYPIDYLEPLERGKHA